MNNHNNEPAIKKMKDTANSFFESINLTKDIPPWLFLCCNVGDCKAYHWNKRTREVTDITLCNRDFSGSASDPGGRLGPRDQENGSPDLRNMFLYSQHCFEGDIIMVVTDGVYDNLDPIHQGYMPSDLGIPNIQSWSDLTHEQAAIASSNFICDFIAKKLKNISKICVSDFTSHLVKHVVQLTENSRTFMKNNPNKRLPKDYDNYPGKLDHTTIVAFCCKKVTLSYDEWMS
eukprot:TRINITY_DN2803_c0_g1_i1.p1 TRINITY_DN2803_c0_g1~~TRINITY_DN2803_c0_g1_i1.p1  ORF type:complete len:231 (-),score=75.74 TRINITY_DN2803_c0_g1_i1:87-779(-)